VRANFVLSGVATGIRRNMTMTIALILSTAIALAFVGAAILADREIANFKHDYEGKLNVSLYLCPPPVKGLQPIGNCAAMLTQATSTAKANNTKVEDEWRALWTQEKDALAAKLDKDPIVTSVSFVSEQEAVDRYRKTVPPLVAKTTQVGDLPASFTIKLQNIKTDYLKFVNEYKDEPGVSGTTNESSVLKTLLNVIDGVRLFSIMIAIVVLVASILLIANTIQVAAAQRKNETSIMRLVGASRWMTELPFMLETVVATFVGGIIALGLITLGKEFVLNNVFKVPVQNGVIPNLGTNDILVAGGLGIIAGIILSAITAFATLRLYVRL
jgi:cell division transport system permease protein